MHYVNGREAREWDPVVYKSEYPIVEGVSQGKLRVGVIHSINVLTESCNCQVSCVLPGCVQQFCATIGKELVHAEDGWSAVVTK